jgi:hypothetical protein
MILNLARGIFSPALYISVVIPHDRYLTRLLKYYGSISGTVIPRLFDLTTKINICSNML